MPKAAKVGSVSYLTEVVVDGNLNDLVSVGRAIQQRLMLNAMLMIVAFLMLLLLQNMFNGKTKHVLDF